jgi:hypothetical protein
MAAIRTHGQFNFCRAIRAERRFQVPAPEKTFDISSSAIIRIHQSFPLVGKKSPLVAAILGRSKTNFARWLHGTRFRPMRRVAGDADFSMICGEVAGFRLTSSRFLMVQPDL